MGLHPFFDLTVDLLLNERILISPHLHPIRPTFVGQICYSLTGYIYFINMQYQHIMDSELYINNLSMSICQTNNK
jgi:hypothetical protein